MKIGLTASHLSRNLSQIVWVAFLDDSVGVYFDIWVFHPDSVPFHEGRMTILLTFAPLFPMRAVLYALDGPLASIGTRPFAASVFAAHFAAGFVIDGKSGTPGIGSDIGISGKDHFERVSRDLLTIRGRGLGDGENQDESRQAPKQNESFDVI